ncbi:MAG TPA: hypothetical protein VKV39_03845 [Candidatus Sulfotelmatobacter sp.]|nr:hypothetical protein [Candidatus Sulfotelmatobacter sp.]
MTVTLVVILAVILLAVGLFVFRAIPGVRAYLDFRGRRLVTCPETSNTAAVQVDSGQAAAGAFLSEPTLRLKECSRWPERQGCGQECLQQIEADPEKCLVWNIVAKWYEGKVCVFCRKPIRPLSHMEHAPALLGREFRTIEWKDVRPEELPAIFSTHQPVCWDCHVAETFRRKHPELVVDRRPDPKRILL